MDRVKALEAAQDTNGKAPLFRILDEAKSA
jgi:hypothetical protein